MFHFRAALAAAMFASLVMFDSSYVYAAPATEIVNVQNGPQTPDQTGGPVTVRFIAINPVRFKIQLQNKQKVVPPPAAPFGLSPTANKLPTPNNAAPPACVGSPSDVLDTVRKQASADVQLLAAEADRVLAAAASEGDSNAQATANRFTDQRGTAFQHAYQNANCDFKKLRDDVTTGAASPALTAASNLIAAYPFLTFDIPVLQVRAADVERDQDVTCRFLQGGSSSNTVTLTLSPLANVAAGNPTDTTGVEISTAEVRCLGQVAVSAGFVFSSLPQRSFQAVAANATLPAPPAGAPTPPPATVQEQSSASVRAIPFAFVHVSPTRCSENCLFISFGAGINSGSSSGASTVDFAGGLTWSLLRYMYVTGGVHLGQRTDLAPGYTLGGPIAAGATVPTVTRTRTGYFLGVTFGGSPGSSQ